MVTIAILSEMAVRLSDIFDADFFLKRGLVVDREEAMEWPEKIVELRALVKRTGPLWTGTSLSGYAADGPYHCGHCRYLVGKDGCSHPAVQADPEVPKAAGLPIVDAARGCCEFVDPKR